MCFIGNCSDTLTPQCQLDEKPRTIIKHFFEAPASVSDQYCDRSMVRCCIDAKLDEIWKSGCTLIEEVVANVGSWGRLVRILDWKCARLNVP